MVDRKRFHAGVVSTEPGRLTQIEAVRREIDKDTESPNYWEGRKVYFTLENGWTVEKVESEGDARREGRRMVNCVGSLWPRVLQGQYVIFSLRDKEGFSKGTILMGNRKAAEQARSSGAYFSYGVCRDLGVTTPMAIDGGDWYVLQIRAANNVLAPTEVLKMLSVWHRQNEVR